jgi:hypothetical protein
MRQKHESRRTERTGKMCDGCVDGDDQIHQRNEGRCLGESDADVADVGMGVEDRLVLGPDIRLQAEEIGMERSQRQQPSKADGSIQMSGVPAPDHGDARPAPWSEMPRPGTHQIG